MIIIGIYVNTYRYNILNFYIHIAIIINMHTISIKYMGALLVYINEIGILAGSAATN